MSLRHLLVSLLAITALGACTEKNPALPDGAVDGDGAVDDDGAVVADANNDPCTANATSCANDVLTTCNAEGSGSDDSACALGCFDEVRCAKLDPSNGMAAHLDAAAEAADLVLSGAATIDTTAETVTDASGGLVVSTAVITGGPVEIFVLRVKSFTANEIAVTGSRALAIVSDGDIALNGTVNNSANLNFASAGSVDDDSTCGQRNGGGTVSTWAGGGGGGFGGSGGNGGMASAFPPGAGGAPNGSASMIPLRGGCNGGGVSEASIGTAPGAGGGAVQLVSNTSIALSASTLIAVNGGGANGHVVGNAVLFCGDSPCYPGHGGGSGGGILLEAPAVSLASSAGLFANGGSGGCLSQANNGINSTDRAAGAVCAEENRGNGGAGGAGATAIGSGGSGSTEFGGGGGGGVGRIRINLPTGATTGAIEGTVSPAASFGTLGTR